jgi:hypothetical protein
MAKVVQPLGSNEARGAVGGLTYNTWRGISTVKTRSGPSTQGTEAQLDIQAKAKACTQAWQALTDAQRHNWRIYSSNHLDPDWTGEDKRLTGYNWFLRINVRRQLFNYAIESTPPTDQCKTNLIDIETYAMPGAQLLTWDTDPHWPVYTHIVDIWLAGPHSPGRYPNIQDAKREGWEEANSIPHILWGPTPGWYTWFLRPIRTNGVAGQFYRLRFEVT